MVVVVVVVGVPDNGSVFWNVWSTFVAKEGVSLRPYGQKESFLCLLPNSGNWNILPGKSVINHFLFPSPHHPSPWDILFKKWANRAVCDVRFETIIYVWTFRTLCQEPWLGSASVEVLCRWRHRLLKIRQQIRKPGKNRSEAHPKSTTPEVTIQCLWSLAASKDERLSHFRIYLEQSLKLSSHAFQPVCQSSSTPGCCCALFSFWFNFLGPPSGFAT